MRNYYSAVLVAIEFLSRRFQYDLVQYVHLHSKHDPSSRRAGYPNYFLV